MKQNVAGKMVPVLIAILGVGGAVAYGQSQAAKPEVLPRTLDDRPDFSGVWSVPMIGSVSRGLRDPSFRSGGEAIFNRKHAKGDDPAGYCMPAGMPRETLAPFPIQFVQSPGLVVILYEYMHFFRIIPTDGRPHREDIEPSYMGDPIGRWDGDTLVVDTVGFNDKTWLDGFGHGHTDALHLVERFRRTDIDTIAYDLTIDDSKILAAPFTQKLTVTRHPDWLITEYICEDNNKAPAQLQSK